MADRGVAQEKSGGGCLTMSCLCLSTVTCVARARAGSRSSCGVWRGWRRTGNREGARASRRLWNPGTYVRPRKGPERASVRPGRRSGAAEERRQSESMMNGLKQSDSAIVPLRAANKGASVPAESTEGGAGTKGNPRGQSTCRTRSRARVSQAAERIPEVGAPCVSAHAGIRTGGAGQPAFLP